MEVQDFSKADKIGIGVSLACAIHCAALPLIVSIGSLKGIAWIDHIVIEILFLIVSLFIAIYSLIRSYKIYHKNILPLVIAFIGFIFFFRNVVFHDHENIILPTIGGILIATAHWVNHQLTDKYQISRSR